MVPLIGESGRCATGSRPTPSSSEVHALGAAPGRWLGVVLCGGASRRMGSDKARLEWDGAPFYVRVAGVLGELCAEVVLASGPTERFGDRRWREVTDASAGHAGAREGPLAALVAGLRLAAREGFDGIVTAPCDVPRLAAAALSPLQWSVAAHGLDALEGALEPAVDVAHWRRGDRDEPLCAALHVRALAPLAAAFERGVRRPTEAFAALRAHVCEAPAEFVGALANVNTPDELARLACCAHSAAAPSEAGGTELAGNGQERMGEDA